MDTAGTLTLTTAKLPLGCCFYGERVCAVQLLVRANLAAKACCQMNTLKHSPFVADHLFISILVLLLTLRNAAGGWL